jgi:hypothetical protein
LVTLYQITQRYISEDRNLNGHRLVKLKSQLAWYFNQADSHASFERYFTHVETY